MLQNIWSYVLCNTKSACVATVSNLFIGKSQYNQSLYSFLFCCGKSKNWGRRCVALEGFNLNITCIMVKWWRDNHKKIVLTLKCRFYSLPTKIVAFTKFRTGDFIWVIPSRLPFVPTLYWLIHVYFNYTLILWLCD